MGGSAQTGAVSPTDAEVIERARSGDHDAFRVLVERYQDRAYRLALRVLRDEEWARDVVQDGFLKVYRSLDRFEGRSSFYTWLYRVVMNLCLDAKRRDRRDRHVEWEEGASFAVDPGAADAASDLYAEQSGPAGALERAQLRTFVARAIEQLPDDARQTLLLREVEGLSYAEIAECLDVPKGTVMSRLHHARRNVREALVASGDIDAQGRLVSDARGET
ncbi:MAG: RNA polymerase sigma factor [Myxococcota bacterium]